MKPNLPRATAFTATLALMLALIPGGTGAVEQLQTASAGAQAAISAPTGTTASNAACPSEDVFYDPGLGEDIVLPKGYKIDVFAKGLNFPTGIGFTRTGDDRNDFAVQVVESGTGLPSRCNNNEDPVWGNKLNATNPFTPDMLVLDRNGRVIRGPLFKPTSADSTKNTGYQPDGPAIGLALENGDRGKLFVSDSNQGIRGAPGKQNNSSRIMTADLKTGTLSPFITGLPTGDHPTENLLVKDGFLYWAQGSATNSGVTGHDNGAGGNQHDIACQDIALSQNVWDSGDGHLTSGYSNHGIARPGAHVKAFEDATKAGMCTGAILRATISGGHPEETIQPFSWGYRNPYTLRFAPRDHALRGGLFTGTDGEDERGARPTNGAPDRLELAQMNSDGTPDYHGWPDRFGFLDSTQSVFNPIGGPADDLCGPPAMPVFNLAACAAAIKAKDVPVRHVLAYPPQPPTTPLALEPPDSSMAGIDFVPNSFVHGNVIRKGAALVAREGDFGFSPANGDPEEGHDIQLVNFSAQGAPLALQLSRAIFNCPKAHQTHLPNGAAACKQDPNNLASADITGDQAFADRLRAINRPTNLIFGPDGALYLVDYGAVRDLGNSDPNSAVKNPADGPLVQIPHTGTIWRITKTETDD
jgi:hypothetical protein